MLWAYLAVQDEHHDINGYNVILRQFRQVIAH